MTCAISTSIIHWCQNTVLEPKNEGAARIDRCFRGVNLHHIDFPKLSWGKRVVDFITGFFLMIPLVGHVVWIFMRTFGNVEKLSEPLVPPTFKTWEDAKVASAELIVEEIAPIAPLEGEAPLSTTIYRTLDSFEKCPEFASTTKVETYADVYIVSSESHLSSSTATYDKLGNIHSLKYKNVSQEVDVEFEKVRNTIHVRGTVKGESIDRHEILEKPEIPWIQQSFGFRRFITSSENKLTFYAIDPKTAKLETFTVTKAYEHAKFPGYERYGEVVELHGSYANGLLSYTNLATTHFCKSTGELLKQDVGFLGMFTLTSRLTEVSLSVK